MRFAGAGDSHGSTAGGAAEARMRSRKVQRILRLEARAQRLLARYERALATTARTMGQARACLDDAQILESSLSDPQLGELRHGRAAAAGAGTSPGSTRPNRPSTTTSH
jgi:hypothetical protein